VNPGAKKTVSQDYNLQVWVSEVQFPWSWQKERETL